MISNLKETKFYFENLFTTEWLATPIHFVGQEFDQDGTKQWVNPYYTPTRSMPNGISGMTTRNYGTVYVACWAENDVEAMGLADATIDFISSNVGTAYTIKNYSIEDHGWHKTNKVFVIISFNVEILEGIC